MQTTTPERLLSVTAHPDDAEMHHAELLSRAKLALAMIATKGEATTLNFTNTPPEQLVQQRHKESRQAMAFFGIRGIWLDLPDGQLMDPGHIGNLSREIVDASLEHEIDGLVSMGSDGYCHHPDHKATHVSTLLAQDTLASDYGYNIPVYALGGGENQIEIPVNRDRKLAGVALHASQFKTTRHDMVDEAFMQDQRSIYTPLLARETYGVLQPRTSLDPSLARKQTLLVR